MRKAGPFHLLGAGAMIGILATTHLWTLLLLAFLVGVFSHRLFQGVHGAAVKTGALVQARIETEKARRTEVRSRARRNLEKTKLSRSERDRVYQQGLMDGRLDATRETWPGEA